LEARRPGEIVVQAVRLERSSALSDSSSITVTLFDTQGSIVRTAAGAIALDIPLESAAR
jgi:hypothetical protein